MKKCNTVAVTIYRVICPACDKDSGCRIDHLLPGPREFGSWKCSECEALFKGRLGKTLKDLKVALTQPARPASRSLR